eukprot:1247880-Pleurochrysis_carterae.AAC.2
MALKLPSSASSHFRSLCTLSVPHTLEEEPRAQGTQNRIELLHAEEHGSPAALLATVARRHALLPTHSNLSLRAVRYVLLLLLLSLRNGPNTRLAAAERTRTQAETTQKVDGSSKDDVRAVEEELCNETRQALAFLSLGKNEKAYLGITKRPQHGGVTPTIKVAKCSEIASRASKAKTTKV